MSPATFRSRLEHGRCNNHLYAGDGREGLVVVWKYEDGYVLIWEECPLGQQFDESSYTRDEHHHFASFDHLALFLAANGLKTDRFEP